MGAQTVRKANMHSLEDRHRRSQITTRCVHPQSVRQSCGDVSGISFRMQTVAGPLLQKGFRAMAVVVGSEVFPENHG
jgi:hypothetical protein